MKTIPANVDELLEHLRVVKRFSSWSGASVLAVEDIKTYCVPGNAKQAKGRQAIWVRSAQSKRPRILFPELVLRAMHFIADPAQRGARQRLDPRSFAGAVTGKDAKLPGLYSNDEIYLALARRLLGLPDDYTDATTKRLETESRRQWKDNHPDIRTRAGLLRDVMLAYTAVRTWYDGNPQGTDLVAQCYHVLRHRHGSMAWFGHEEEHRTNLAAVLADIRTNPGHADIRDLRIAVFAMLYTHGLLMAGKIRDSAITYVVNHLADAADDGILDDCERQIEQVRAERSARLDAILQEFVDDTARGSTKSHR